MQSIDDRLIFSATDLSNYLACPHLSLLNRRTALGGLWPPRYDDPGIKVLQQRGFEHERNFLENLKANGVAHIVEIQQPSSFKRIEDWERLAADTVAAMRAGADVIYQGGFFDGAWIGRPDFLVKVDTPSRLGGWSYEVADTKLAREAKGGALLQVLLYTDLLASVQGVSPVRVQLALGGPDARTEHFRVADYSAYFRSVRQRFLQHVADAPADVPLAVEPVEHCAICAWSEPCKLERRDVDHLSFVAGITRSQRAAFVAGDIRTLEQLGGLEILPATRFGSITRTSLYKIQDQARIQLDGRTAQTTLHELLVPIVEGQGLAALPAPSPGDLFFDFEGDPFALTYGIEYLFGFADTTGDYTGWWALDRAEEKRAFEKFVDFVVQRLEEHPEMHVYHFAPYEPTALKKLMGLHATREKEVDRLLTERVFVDLYRVVKQAVRASVESYSIKKLEPLYGFAREVDLRSASSALANFEAWLELGGSRESGEALLSDIEGYNRDDCISTLRLREWLEKLRAGVNESAEIVPRPKPPLAEAKRLPSEHQQKVEAVVAQLTADVPSDPDARKPEQTARWLLAQLLEFHRREKKSMWWELFRCMELDDNELLEDSATLAGLEYLGPVGTEKKSEIHRYRFPPQEHGFKIGFEARDPATEKSAGEVRAIDDDAGTIDLIRGLRNQAPHPRAIIPFDNIRDNPLPESLLGIAIEVLQHGLGDASRFRCAVDILLRIPPRAAGGAALMRSNEGPVAAGCRLLDESDAVVLPIQGPPGAGKTYTAAAMILHALKSGKRVGITAPSHKVIATILEKVCSAADQAGFLLKGIQKGDESQQCASSQIVATKDNAKVLEALQNGDAQLAAGTAWLWARDDMIDSVDVLFVDEAGQFSLANAMAIAPATKNLVLLGDPQQLDQPQKGVHPPGAAASVLQHLIGVDATVSADRGLFLDMTWRLHPDVCQFTSEMFYDGRLAPRAGLERQAVTGGGAMGGTGLRLIPVQHVGNVDESPEEVEVIMKLVGKLLGERRSWINSEGAEARLELKDILIIAPYNVQVASLATRLPTGARVGTVDKFQGQEAPIVIYSLTSSSAEDAPRGMGFLYNSNRLNVATSRARCLAVLVASPQLFVPDCRTPEQMRLANAFCRFLEMAPGQ